MYLNILPVKNSTALHALKAAHFPLLTALLPPSFCRWMLEPKSSILTCSILPTFHVMLKYTSSEGHLGHAGQSCWAQVLFSLWTNCNTKFRKAFLRRNPKDLIQEGVTEEICGLKHLQEGRASFEPNVPMSQPHLLIMFMTGGCNKTAERCACSPAPAVLLFHSKHCTERAAEPPCVTGDLQHFL